MPAYQRTSKLTTGGWTQKNQFITESVVVLNGADEENRTPVVSLEG